MRYHVTIVGPDGYVWMDDTVRLISTVQALQDNATRGGFTVRVTELESAA